MRNEMRDIAYNKYLDESSEFLAGFMPEDGDSDHLYEVARRICHKLLHNVNLPLAEPAHPFHRYGVMNEESVYANFTRLAQDMMLEIEDQHLKPFIISFFHSGGVYREEMEDLVIDSYYEFVLRSNGIVPDPNDEDEDEEEDEVVEVLPHEQVLNIENIQDENEYVPLQIVEVN